jgi:predicted nucleotidyltransferase
MDSATKPSLTHDVIAILQAHEAELRAAGIRRMSVFGSVVRGDFADESDVDLAVELEPSARMDLIRRAPLGCTSLTIDETGRLLL